jgi:hypothetical protein
VAVALCTWLAARYFVRRIGGYTGDCLGATQQIAELAFYLGHLMQLYLIRHPPPQVAEGICYGATDLLLAGRLPKRSPSTIQLHSCHEGLPFFSSPIDALSSAG